MRRIQVVAGEQFGKWTILAAAASRNGRRMMLCRCECGTEGIVYLEHLRNGRSKGCKPCAIVTHGKSHQPTWQSWQAMKNRCSNPKHPAYARYGGRGIAVCDRWTDFAAFYEDMGERPEGMSLERIDGDLGYFKENCRWATAREQSNNQSTNRIVEFEGKSYTLAQLSEHLGINYKTLYKRLADGKPLDAPVRVEKSRSLK